MAPFNQRQIGYIQAIAGRQQHRTLTCGHIDGQISSNDSADTNYDGFKYPQTLHSDKVIGQGLNTDPDDAEYSDDKDKKSLLLYTWLLDDAFCCYDSRNAHNDNKLTTGDISGLTQSIYGIGDYKALNVFEAPVAGSHAIHDIGHFANAHESDAGHVQPAAGSSGELVRNPELIPSNVRATPDGFLNSTDIKFRFTLPATKTGMTASATNPMGQDHYEFRWIVWRSKRPTLHRDAGTSSTIDLDHSNLEAIRDGVSFRNPGYDFFMGQTGRKRGLLGYTLNKDLDKEKGSPDAEAYSGFRYVGSNNFSNTNDVKHTAYKPEMEDRFTVDDLMTARINKDDYVVMKDVRFFLGKQHGKSHFEDHLHWDWNDPIDTEKDNVLSSATLNNKNYRWHMTLLGTSGGSGETALNVRALWTTKMESG